MPSKPPTRRQQKIMSLIKEAVSDIIQNRLNDPRIEGFVTVTQVDVSPDVRNADIYLSVMAKTETIEKRTHIAIQHATKHIQSLLAERMTTRFVPILRLLKDEKIKKTLDTLRVIEEAAREYREKDAARQDSEENQEETE
ncbi:MAG: 30S ribosome-binding factor RbfA [Planctomycetes bacterium]|nr:30S ribosome-binding factor RbfA [Planctomycetota bacterium]